jgi:hypothetical protein
MPRAAVAAETTSSVERSDARPPPIHGFMMLDLYVRSPPPRKRVPMMLLLRWLVVAFSAKQKEQRTPPPANQRQHHLVYVYVSRQLGLILTYLQCIFWINFSEFILSDPHTVDVAYRRSKRWYGGPKVMETRRKFSPFWDTKNKQKKGICESASTRDKKPQKVADSQTCFHTLCSHSTRGIYIDNNIVST